MDLIKNDSNGDGGPEINDLSNWYDVFQVYRGQDVSVHLREINTVLDGTVMWVGSGLVELQAHHSGQAHWIRHDAIAAVTTRSPA